MADRLILKGYNFGGLNSLVMKLGRKLDIYSDFRITEFTAKVYQDKSNKSHVFYSKHRGRTFTEEDRAKTKDYSGNIADLLVECKRNYFDGILPDSEDLTRICDVVYIPEVKGITFVSFGYKIGRACAEQWFLHHDDSGVDYVIDNDMHTISGKQLKQIAHKFMSYDINISSNLGYMLYNRQITVRDKNDKIKRPAENNTRRYNVGLAVKDLTALMQNFTDFIPIGFRWATYTPIWFMDSEFENYLKNHTRFGFDWVEVPNKTKDGNRLPDDYRPEDSVTFYTTKRRMYEILRVKLDGYNYKFTNELISSIFLNGLGYIGSDFVALSKTNKNMFILPIEYYALDPDSQKSYEIVGMEDIKKAQVRQVTAQKLVGLYWNTMTAREAEDSRPMINNLASITKESLTVDVSQEEAMSSNMFNYVG